MKDIFFFNIFFERYIFFYFSIYFVSRTAVNSSSGVRTAFGGIYTGLLVIVCLAFLMPFCAFIPKATLAAVIMTAVIFSVEHHVIRPMWSSKSESSHVARSES